MRKEVTEVKYWKLYMKEILSTKMCGMQLKQYLEDTRLTCGESSILDKKKDQKLMR